MYFTAELFMEKPLDVNDNYELVVNNSEEFTLTCEGDSPISWNYSNYIPVDGDVSS